MKKIKKLLAVVFAFVFIVTATGCTVTSDMTIGANNKVTAKTEIKISKTEIDSMVTKMGEDSILTSSDIVEMLKEFGAKSCVEGGETYYVISQSETAALSELNTNETVGVAANYTTTDVWSFGDASLSFLGMDIVSSLDLFKQYGIELTTTTTIKMPYKITKTNLSTVDEYTVTETGNLNNVGSSVSYIITEKSTAAWTKAENVEAEILKMAKPVIAKQLTANIDIMATYSNKTTIKAVVNAPYCEGGVIEYKVGNGSYKTLKSFTVKKAEVNDLMSGIGAFDNFTASVKNVKAGNKYTFRVIGYYNSETLGKIYSAGKTDTVKAINFNKISVKKLKAGKKSFSVTVKSNDRPDEYQIQYSTNKKFKGAKIKKVNAKNKTFTVKKLKSGNKYYVRVRKVVISTSFKQLKGNWSKTKSVTVK